MQSNRNTGTSGGHGPMQAEPVISVTVITTLVSSLFVAITLAAPGVDPAWEKAIIGIIVAAWPVVTAVWARSRVVAPDTARKATQTAARTGIPVDPMRGLDPGDPATW